MILILIPASAAMYSRVDTGGKESFLDKAKQLREERAQSKQNENAIVTVQVSLDSFIVSLHSMQQQAFGVFLVSLSL